MEAQAAIIPMTFSDVLFWLAVGGAMGGATDLLFHIRFGKDGFGYKSPTAELASIIKVTFPVFLGLTALSAFIGISGAIAIELVLIGIQKFSTEATVDNELFLLSISIIAGFGARRLLPQLRDRLEEEVIRNREETREASEDAHEAMEEAREARLQLRVLASLRPEAPASERAACIDYLTKELQSDPTERTNAITLGRLQRASGDLGSAVQTLTGFLAAKGEERDKDYADALYNRACYNALLWKPTSGPEVLEKVLSDLRQSFDIAPENRDDASKDRDFDEIRKQNQFRALLEAP